jgi:acetylornithine deacetylase/succinyl-diaminopimelate desuccinylase-like protein
MLKRHQMLGLAAALLATTVHAAPAKLDKKLMAAATAEAPALAKTLERMIRIESGTGDAEGLAAMATLLETELKARGATVERIKPTGATGRHRQQKAVANRPYGHRIPARHRRKGAVPH